MKKALVGLFAGLAMAFAAALPAQAAGVAGGIVIGGGVEVAQGAVSGVAVSSSKGSSVAGSEVIGTGNSYQHTDTVTGGASTIGGSVNWNGSQVVTQVVNSATINSNGVVSGNTPMTAADGSIINGTTGFASTNGTSDGAATFSKVGIGGVAGIGGAAAITGF